MDMVIRMGYLYKGAINSEVRLEQDTHNFIIIKNMYGEVIHISSTGIDLVNFLRKLDKGDFA